MFQAALPDSLTRAPGFFSLDQVKTEFLQHWTHLAKERFLIGLLKCFDDYPTLQSITFYVDDHTDLMGEFPSGPSRYKLSIDTWDWTHEPEPPVLMTEIEQRMGEVFADELADFVTAPFDRESTGRALTNLASS